MAEFRFTGPVWLLRLDNHEAETVSAVLVVTAPPISPITGPLAVIVAVEASAAYITLMNKLGGNQGVDVHGVAGSRGVIVTPRASGMYEKLMEGAQVGVAVGTVGEFLLQAAAAQPGLSASLGLATAAKIFSHVAGGTPLGWAVAGAFGAAINLLLSEPDPDQHGGVHADRDHLGPWEMFILEGLGTLPAGALVPAGAPVSAVARQPEHLDLFITGNDGRVYTSWWHAGSDWSGINDNWRPIGGFFPAGAPVSALARQPEHLDLFITGNDGRVYTSWWHAGSDWSGINDNWRPILGEVAEISLLSWQGFFSARGGGGGPVFANRPWVQSWERWTLINNGDGTVSFRTNNGHFLVAEEGGGRECWANRTAIGPWEKFVIENLPGGQIALRSRERWKYVSVQQDL